MKMAGMSLLHIPIYGKERQQGVERMSYESRDGIAHQRQKSQIRLYHPLCSANITSGLSVRAGLTWQVERIAKPFIPWYATTSTDTGHATPGGQFAFGHPEKLIDFSWRSEHEMTVKAKAIVEMFYGTGPRLSYWNGCSTG